MTEASYVYDVYDNSGFCADLPTQHAIGQSTRSVFRVYGTDTAQTVLDGDARS